MHVTGIESIDRTIVDTPCPYANAAKVAADRVFPDAAMDWRDRVWDRLNVYVDAEINGCPDGLFLEFPTTTLGDNVPALAANFKRLCERLVWHEYQDLDCVESVSYLEGLHDWQPRIRNVGFFVLAFSSFYPASHPRHVSAANTSLLFFQPQSSFDTALPDDPNRRIERRLRVAKIFADEGKAYRKPSSRIMSMILSVDPAVGMSPETMWWKYDGDSPPSEAVFQGAAGDPRRLQSSREVLNYSG